MENKLNAVTLEIGKRQDFARTEFANAAGLKISLYHNGGTVGVFLDGLMINQVEGHPLQGGLDRVWLRMHRAGGFDCLPVSGAQADCAFHENGAVWNQDQAGIAATMQLLLHPELPILFRVCRARNNGMQPVTLDWLAGQDLGLADPGMLKNNEAYVCQYLDHRIADHPVAGKVVFSRNNLHPAHPFAVNCCLQGAQSASTDGYQFFGAGFKLSGTIAALSAQALENRVRQYEFAYAALQSRTVELLLGQENTTVFALYALKEHQEITSQDDLARVDEILRATLPEPGEKKANGTANAFFAQAPQLAVDALDEAQLQKCFAGEWRHIERSARGELFSFFCGIDTHVVLPAKESIVERPHGTMLRSAHGVNLEDNVLCVTCYGYGAFGSQFSVGNSAFGRFSTLLRNALNLERSSGIRLFANCDGEWHQLGFPSAFAMERDRVRWIYRTQRSTFEVIAQATTDTIEYSTVPISGTPPALRLTWEVCGDPNEFDGAPRVEWDAKEKLLSVFPTPGSLLHNKFPEACLLARLDAAACTVGHAKLLGGNIEPYVVIDVPSGEFRLTLTGHYGGKAAALWRFGMATVPDWADLTAHFELQSDVPAVAKLADTVRWFAHNAMIHFAAPRGMEQYGTAAWGTRDVCQGALEFLLAVGHDQTVADMLCELFAHQYPNTGTWPQWFMFDEFREVQSPEAHGDIVFWPIKALCDYIEQTGDLKILKKKVRYTDPETFAFTKRTAWLHTHVKKAVSYIYRSCVKGTALPSYGNGDWNDSLQPADPSMKTRMVSGWTAGLALQTLGALSRIWAMAGFTQDADRLDGFLLRMKSDYNTHIIKDGVSAGFVLFDGKRTSRLLHPSDDTTGIHYRLLPINRAIIAELFSPHEMESHLELVHRHLKFPDGVRLMDTPPEYRGGKSVHFQRAETAAHFGREIGLQYVHANIRYCEALAKVGRADELLESLLIISPVATAEVVPNARPRQANLYFSSSDAEVYDRYEAARRMGELKEGKVGVLGGWRLYSSGPGIYIGLIISRLFGIRRSFGSVLIDPVLPSSMNGVQLCLDWNGKKVRWTYHRTKQSFDPDRVLVNGATVVDCERRQQTYRGGGLAIDAAHFDALLNRAENTVEIFL